MFYISKYLSQRYVCFVGFDGFGEVMAPANQNRQQVPQPKKEEKLIKGDIDASMALLAGNLNIGRDGNQMKK